VGKDGTPQFYEFMRRRGPQHFFAFDILWLDGRDLRNQPLIERKRLLRQIVRPQMSPILYVDCFAATGIALFEAVCARDMEGIVAKLANAPYTPEATTWVKIKNPHYTQVEGRADFFWGLESDRPAHEVRRAPGRADYATAKTFRQQRRLS
jgi:ATP-dependent DNA ligase